MHAFLRHLHFRYTELNEMYISMAVKSFALGLISIFIPIYLYKLGYAVPWILGYLLLEQVFKLLAVISIARLIARYGAKHIMAGGYALMITHLLLLYSLPLHHWPLSLVALVSALATNAHWMGYHIQFAQAITKGRQGHDYSLVSLWTSLLTALGPLIGGYIGSRTNLGNVFILALVLMLSAGWPLFRTGELLSGKPIVVGRLHPKPIWRNLISYVGFGFDQQAAEVIWPFFIFLTLTSYVSVGLVTTVALVVSLLAMYFIGRYSDRGYQAQLIRFGSILTSLLYVLRTTAGTLTGFFAINSATETVRDTFQIPWYANFYGEAKEAGPVEYVLMMQLSLNAARIVLWSILLILSFSLPLVSVLKCGFILAAFASLLIMLARVKKPLA